MTLLIGCAKEGVIVMDNEEQEVLLAFEKMQQAMIDKDVDTMSSLVSEDTVFVHMSGRTQTKEEFFEEIENGTLNYYGYKIDNPIIKVDGDHATLQANITLNAKVYGMTGTWTLNTSARFIKINGLWIQTN